MPPKQSSARQRIKKLLREFSTLAAFVAIVIIARGSFADHYHVPTGSMLPTVQLGDRILVDKRAYGLRVPGTTWYALEFEGPQPGDVVVLESPESGEVLLKRVVAIAGEQVAVRAGRLTIDGRPIPIQVTAEGLLEQLGDNTHSLRLDHGGGPDFGPEVVPPGMVLVMGDNRGSSLDGRMFGFVGRQVVMGRALGVFRSKGEFVWREL
jgi:signal peptidase I